MVTVSLPKLIVILGPTASGKTDFAIQLAKKFDGEIISADSRQIYKEMDIGTAKPQEFCGIQHHLLDIITPDKSFSIADFTTMVKDKISDIVRRHHVPFLVGGTAQYIFGLVDNWEIPSAPPNTEFRETLEKKSLEELQKLIDEKDPATSEFIDRKNKRRLIRALEVIIITGKSFADQRKKGKSEYDVLVLGLNPSRAELNRRIDLRIDKMFEEGLESEVKYLSKKYSLEAAGLQSIGYREFKDYFNGIISLEEVVHRIKINTHQYAKRQMTWFKKDSRIKWCKDIDEAALLCGKFLK